MVDTNSPELVNFYNSNLHLIPQACGIYKFIAPGGEILYIGKAKNLKKRITSYFKTTQSSKNTLLLTKASTIDWVVTSNEVESLLLERNLISEYKPKFNILLKYGDGYVGLAISKEKIPKIFTWRGIPPKNAHWFGPYPNTSSKNLLDSILPIFPVRSCADKFFTAHHKVNKPCLLFETNMCVAPCLDNDQELLLSNLKEFLSGGSQTIVNTLREQMSNSAQQENFELALLRKRQITTLEQLVSSQEVVSNIASSLFIAFKTQPYLNKTLISFGGVRIENGLVVGVQTNYALLDNENEDEYVALLNQFLIFFKNYKKIYLEKPLFNILKKSDTQLEVKYYQLNTTTHKSILNMLKANINLNIKNGLSRKLFDVEDINSTLISLATQLSIKNISRIECIDISHTQGKNPIGALVVGVNGFNSRKEYRRVNIPSQYGGDDLASIAYTITKRFVDSKLGLEAYPDVLLIDGGLNQCKIAQEVVDNIFVGVDYRPKVISIAKRMEEIYVGHLQAPLIFSRNSDELKLLMALRDQAHNHAITHHRLKRDKASLETFEHKLDFLGLKTKQNLLSAYPEYEVMLTLTLEELLTIKGISRIKAERLLLLFSTY